MTKKISLLALIALLFLSTTASDCGSGPSAPETELRTTFRGTFTPAAVASNGVCGLQLIALPTGGLPDYRCLWSMAWINQASSARGYPNECSIDISLPDTFGPGLYGIDLSVRDARDRIEEIARAGTDERFDCQDRAQKTFFGS